MRRIMVSVFLIDFDATDNALDASNFQLYRRDENIPFDRNTHRINLKAERWI